MPQRDPPPPPRFPFPPRGRKENPPRKQPPPPLTNSPPPRANAPGQGETTASRAAVDSASGTVAEANGKANTGARGEKLRITPRPSDRTKRAVKCSNATAGVHLRLRPTADAAAPAHSSSWITPTPRALGGSDDSAESACPLPCAQSAIPPSRYSGASTCSARSTFASKSGSHATRRKSGLTLGIPSRTGPRKRLGRDGAKHAEPLARSPRRTDPTREPVSRLTDSRWCRERSE